MFGELGRRRGKFVIDQITLENLRSVGEITSLLRVFLPVEVRHLWALRGFEWTALSELFPVVDDGQATPEYGIVAWKELIAPDYRFVDFKDVRWEYRIGAPNEFQTGRLIVPRAGQFFEFANEQYVIEDGQMIPAAERMSKR